MVHRSDQGLTIHPRKKWIFGAIGKSVIFWVDTKSTKNQLKSNQNAPRFAGGVSIKHAGAGISQAVVPRPFSRGLVY